MVRINQLREQRSTLAKAVRNSLDQAPGKLWTAEHQKTYDENMAEIERIDAEVKRFEDAAKLAADERFDDALADVERDRAKKKVVDQNSPEAVTGAWLRGGLQSLTAEQAQVFRNVMSTTTGSEGGYTVPTTIASELIESLKAYGGMREVAESFTTASGNPMSYPSTDGTSEVGELVAENVAATAADISFGTVSLNVYKFGSKKFAVPIELLQDSVIDVVGLVRRRAAERIGRSMNTYFTTGTGTNQPRGIVTGASLGKTGTTGQTLTVIHDDLVDLVHSVNSAYRQDPRGVVAFQMSDTAFKVARKLKDSSNRPLYLPGVQPEAILGYPVIVNDDVPVPAANAKSIFFGNWREAYKIRDALAVSLFRFADSTFTNRGQVGFLAFARSGGTLANTGAVKAYRHSAT